MNEKPEELSKRGGAHYSTAAFYLIDAIENDVKNTQIVATQTMARSRRLTMTRRWRSPQAAPAPFIRGLMQQVKSYETLTVKAAVTGRRGTAYQAFVAIR